MDGRAFDAREIYLKQMKKDQFMLVLDSFREQLTEKVKKALRCGHTVQSAVILGGCTSKLQQLDVSIDKLLNAQELLRAIHEGSYEGPCICWRQG